MHQSSRSRSTVAATCCVALRLPGSTGPDPCLASAAAGRCQVAVARCVQMLELESSRERNLEKLAKEAKRAKRAADEAATRAASAPPPLTARSASVAEDAEAAALEEEFFAAVKQAKLETGL